MIAIPILPNISRRKVNQAVKLGQFVAYNVRNVFFFSNIMQKMKSDTSFRPLFVV